MILWRIYIKSRVDITGEETNDSGKSRVGEQVE